MNQTLAQFVRVNGAIPLAWAGSTMKMDYLNFGDALSPVMVALVSGKQIRRVPSNSMTLRMAAVGTIGHGFQGGEVWFWGTGCSNWKNPLGPAETRIRFSLPGSSRFMVSATRGPVSEQLLNGGDKGSGVYGDPVWLLPRFYRPELKKRWKLGVILHLSELQDRKTEAHPLPQYERYTVPPELADDVHLITTVTHIGVRALKEKVDEILCCERIVSTSLHGMVIAESYGIPCLYFAPHGPRRGLSSIDLDPDGATDLRIVDLYRGLGVSALSGYVQDRKEPTDWASLMSAIDLAWEPKSLDEDALVEALPVDVAPISNKPSMAIWDHSLLHSLQFQHDVAELRRGDRRTAANVLSGRSEVNNNSPSNIQVESAIEFKEPAAQHWQATSETGSVQEVPASTSPAAPRALLSFNHGQTTIPLSWVWTTLEHPHANLGDALSAFVVSSLAGLPVRRANFDQPVERLVAVGTIGQHQRGGILHFWGTGVDAGRNPTNSGIDRYVRPPDTDFHIHALRGPNSAETLRNQGIPVPNIYGDPVWLLPRFWPMEDTEKTHDLGVILHISELESADPQSGPRKAFDRYQVPSGLEGIRLINTYCAPTAQAMWEKVREIASCRRIVSTSLHGLVIAEAYGIPCAWFATYGSGSGVMLDVTDPAVRVDHRMRDFYMGVGKLRLPAYLLDRSRMTNWSEVIRAVDEQWEPVIYDAQPLIDAFPVPLAVRSDAKRWPIPLDALAQVRF
jgi:hypothetical protein